MIIIVYTWYVFHSVSIQSHKTLATVTLTLLELISQSSRITQKEHCTCTPLDICPQEP